MLERRSSIKVFLGGPTTEWELHFLYLYILVLAFKESRKSITATVDFYFHLFEMITFSNPVLVFDVCM